MPDRIMVSTDATPALVGANTPPDADDLLATDTLPARDSTVYRSSAHLCFRVDRADIEPDYMDNAAQLRRLADIVDSLQSDTANHITRIALKAFASPEALEGYNSRLARRRMEQVKAYILQHFNVDGADFTFGSESEDWAGLRRMIAASDSIQHQKNILFIVDSSMDLDWKEKLIREYYPADYRYIFDNFYPSLRRSDIDVEYMRYFPLPVVEEPEETVADTLVAVIPEPEPEPEPEPAVETDCDEGLNPWLAVKTNLLFDAALAPNVEVERWFGQSRQWSVMAEVWFPWYVWHHNSRAYEVLNIGVEARRWFHRYDPCHRWLTGFFAGAFFMGGKYDIEWASKGRQGEYWSAGLTAGFAHRIGRRWNMEYSVSGGMFHTDFRRYYGMFDDRHLIWQHNGNAGYQGPLKAKVSLIYLLGKNKPGYTRQKGGQP